MNPGYVQPHPLAFRSSSVQGFESYNILKTQGPMSGVNATLNP